MLLVPAAGAPRAFVAQRSALVRIATVPGTPGTHAAFDPISNLKVGVQVLRECIARAGSLEAGIRWYVGAANLASDGGYLGKVLTEQGHMKRVAGGGSVSTTVPIYRAPKPEAPVQEAAASPSETQPAGAGERVALAD